MFIWSDRPPRLCISGISRKKEGAPQRLWRRPFVPQEHWAFLGGYVANVTVGVGDAALTGRRQAASPNSRPISILQTCVERFHEVSSPCASR